MLGTASGDYSHNDSATERKANAQAESCSFELISVPIVRPWFTANPLQSNLWAWNASFTP
jgi:hypothetical protein